MPELNCFDQFSSIFIYCGWTGATPFAPLDLQGKMPHHDLPRAAPFPEAELQPYIVVPNPGNLGQLLTVFRYDRGASRAQKET